MRDAFEAYRKRKLDRKSEDAYVYDQGKEAGEQIGMERGIEQGKQEVLLDLVQKGKLDVDTAAETCGITPKEFGERLKTAKTKTNRCYYAGWTLDVHPFFHG